VTVLLAGVPQVAACLGPGGDPVGGDQRAVQTQVRRAGGVRVHDELLQVEVDAMTTSRASCRYPLGGGADLRVGGPRMQVGAVAQPEQHQQR
jgi:hypothetical protein